MRTRSRVWFCAETILGVLFALLFVYSVFARDWIEVVFHIDPDRGTGYLEWLIVGGLLTLTLICGYLARREWRRTSLAAV